jgi:putative NADPH-quinone reductase
MIFRHPLLITLSEKLNGVCSYVQPLPRESTEKKKVLVIHCHPVPESYSSALANAAIKGLKTAGHEVRVKRLYFHGDSGECYEGKSFPPALTCDERREYLDPQRTKDRELLNPKDIPNISPEVAEAISDLRWCDTLVLVYPTWWYNLPAMMKGFIDRVLLPGVAFKLPEKKNSFSLLPAVLAPGLPNIKKIGVVTTYGSSYALTMYCGDNSRRCIERAVRPVCAPDCLLTWHGLHDMDFTTEERRKDFLAKVELAYTLF